MTERKFTRGLNKPGMAAQLRESISLSIRESSVMSKPIMTEPLDVEEFIMKNKTLIQNDPQRELLIYPNDDVSEIILPRKLRTNAKPIVGLFDPPNSAINYLPIVEQQSSKNSELSNETNITESTTQSHTTFQNGTSSCKLKNKLQDEATSKNKNNDVKVCHSKATRFTRQALYTYRAQDHLLEYKYTSYGGTCHELPKIIPSDSLTEEVFEIDVDQDLIDEQMTRSQADSITKQGYLFRVPDSGSERLFANIGNKSFKKRYCCLRQEVDGTYVLELHKDEKQSDSKTTIFMDFCSEIIHNPKRGRFCFEVQMVTGHKSFTLAAENEDDFKDWLNKLLLVLQQNKLQEDKRKGSLERKPSELPPENSFGTLKGLDQSMNPQLIKYARETDTSIIQARQENRRRLFAFYQSPLKSLLINNIGPYRENFGKRIFVVCERLRFRLQLLDPNFKEESDNCRQVEPYITSLALYDAKAGRKISESFYFNINDNNTNEMLPTTPVPESVALHSVPKNDFREHEENNHRISKAPYSLFDSISPDVLRCPKDQWKYLNQCIFPLRNCNTEIFLVLKIEKILQGNIVNTSEPYLKAGRDPKLGVKVNKAVRNCAQNIGHYRQPFAWAAKPLFKPYTYELDTEKNEFIFKTIYRQDVQKLKDDELVKVLSEYNKPEKLNKFTVIPGYFTMLLKEVDMVEGLLDKSLTPLSNASLETKNLTLEMTEFENNSGANTEPFTEFCNNIFVYPLSLHFDSQRLFTRARNITVVVEFRDSDDENSTPLECIYGRPGQKILVSKMASPVLHHNPIPSWYEEIKIRLPLGLFPEHHLLFSFYHVSCNMSKKREIGASFETPIGYAWLPLLHKGKINIEEQVIPVAATLPAGYLSIQPLGLGKGNCGPEVQWIDNQRPLFTVGLRLDSTVLTADQHLHNLFTYSERLLEGSKLTGFPTENEICKILKATHAIDMSSLINFFPTLLNELFTLLVHSQTEEIALNIIRLLTNIIHMIEDAKRMDLLYSYIKYAFHATYYSQKTLRTVHGELTKYLPVLLNPNNTDFLIINKFMRYSNIFFDIIIKSMGQYLISKGRIRMLRKERFPKEYSNSLENLLKTLIPYITLRYKDLTEEVEQLNKSIAQFMRRCLAYMDRGYVFKLIGNYMDSFTPNDPRILQELKLHFLHEICLHEHYVPLNLPIFINTRNRPPEIIHYFNLTEEYCRQHFLSGILLQEVKNSLNQTSHTRQYALNILNNLLAKHELDNRYKNRGQLSRIALLYVPWLGIVMENIHRIEDQFQSPNVHGYADSVSYTKRLSCASSYAFSKDSTLNSINSTPRFKNHKFMSSEQSSPFRYSINLKDSNYLAAIAGQEITNGISNLSLNSLNSSESQNSKEVNKTDSVLNSSNSVTLRNGHSRSVSVTQTIQMPRFDKFNSSESKDILFGFLFIIKYLSQEQMIAWLQNCNETEILQFLLILDLCLSHFRYVGKNNIIVNSESRLTQTKLKANTLPIRGGNTFESELNVHESRTLNLIQNRDELIDESSKNQRVLYESNLATEIGMIVLDCLGLYLNHFRRCLTDSIIIPNLARIYLRFLQLGQSEGLTSHVFAALRSFINNFSSTIFKGNAVLCGQMVYELLRACDCRLVKIRHEACAVLYLLMRSNFEFSGRKGLTRVHLQVIISVSQMIGNVIGLNNARFQESLSLINSYANSDKAMKDTGFSVEVKDLTRRVRTVLMATAQMQANQMDPERLLELQYSLANSYASTPELRHTWLITMARNHEKNGNFSEAACCHLHIAALMCEYLHLRGICKINWNSTAFAKISRNIPIDEQGLKLDAGAQDSQYNEQMLLDQLKLCADFLHRAERFECLGELYKLILPIYERSRNYFELAHSYEHLYQAYNKVIEVNRSGKRILGRFYRVIFYGMLHFEDDHTIEYVYKEPKLTSLSEISDRLAKLYKDKFGADVVKLIMDSSPVNVNDLDPKLAYIQITHVIPFFTKEELDQRLNEFEQNHDVDTFMYETPFTKHGPAQGSVDVQWKRKTVIKTKYSFPYVLKRIPVKSHEIFELSPIEVAIDEMQSKVTELEEVIMPPPDVKKLQLRLQGSVAVTVNAGPLAYAQAFLDPEVVNNYSLDRVDDLKDVFRDFICVCHKALLLNERMITADQKDYHNALKENYEKLCQKLSDILNEAVQHPSGSLDITRRNSLVLFNAISGSSHHSSNA